MAILASNLPAASCAMRATAPKVRRRIDTVAVLGRIKRAFRAAQRRSRERDIAEFVSRSGGRLTDSVERELMDRHMRTGTGGWL